MNDVGQLIEFNIIFSRTDASHYTTDDKVATLHSKNGSQLL
jgi:hypothetical protein